MDLLVDPSLFFKNKQRNMPFKQTILFFLFTALSSLCFGLVINTKDFPMVGDKKGSLLVVNEMHGVRSNPEAYLHLLTHLNAQLHTGDTLNLFLEIPYSKSVL